MNRYPALSEVADLRRHRVLAVGLVVFVAVGGCGSAEEPGSLSLLRTPHLGTPMTMSKTGDLKVSPAAGCLMLFTDEEFPYPIIFDDNLAIEVKNDQLYLDEKAVGEVGATGVHVSVLGRDGRAVMTNGPVMKYPDDGKTLIDSSCSQLQPMVVEQILVRP